MWQLRSQTFPRFSVGVAEAERAQESEVGVAPLQLSRVALA